MRILYVTSWVLGDSGANAADIFPRLAVAEPTIDKVIVADFERNRHHVETVQGAEFLSLRPWFGWLDNGLRIAKAAKRERIDVIHIFYRQQNAVLLIVIRIGLWLTGSPAQIVMDHRSVNLVRGWRRRRKLALNSLMQRFTHHLAGNPWAVETNHGEIRKPKHIIDLGYDHLPESEAREPDRGSGDVNVWFIGSLSPTNRKSDFLFRIFQAVAERQSETGEPERRVVFHVAGPTTAQQEALLREIPGVVYHGIVPRDALYRLLRSNPGLGLAYMNHEFHEYAPSLKCAEYALMRFRILASDTLGLKMQTERMNLSRVRFVTEDEAAWTDAILEQARFYSGLEPPWVEASDWSYPAIFRRQVLGLYREIAG